MRISLLKYATIGRARLLRSSRDYRAFEDYLLPAEAVRDTGIGGETDPAGYVASRAATLHERLNFVADRASRGDLDGVEIEDGKLYIARIPLAVPDAARDLALRLKDRARKYPFDAHTPNLQAVPADYSCFAINAPNQFSSSASPLT